MSKQYNKAEKRQRRQAYLKRKKNALKSKAKSASTPVSASPATITAPIPA
jgi:hypothetical protein